MPVAADRMVVCRKRWMSRVPAAGRCLKVDPETGAVVWADKKKAPPKNFDDLVSRVEAQRSVLDQKFARSVQQTRHAGEILDKKFEEARRRAEQDPDGKAAPPVRQRVSRCGVMIGDDHPHGGMHMLKRFALAPSPLVAHGARLRPEPARRGQGAWWPARPSRSTTAGRASRAATCWARPRSARPGAWAPTPPPVSRPTRISPSARSGSPRASTS